MPVNRRFSKVLMTTLLSLQTTSFIAQGSEGYGDYGSVNTENKSEQEESGFRSYEDYLEHRVLEALDDALGKDDREHLRHLAEHRIPGLSDQFYVKAFEKVVASDDGELINLISQFVNPGRYILMGAQAKKWARHHMISEYCAGLQIESAEFIQQLFVTFEELNGSREKTVKALYQAVNHDSELISAQSPLIVAIDGGRFLKPKVIAFLINGIKGADRARKKIRVLNNFKDAGLLGESLISELDAETGRLIDGNDPEAMAVDDPDGFGMDEGALDNAFVFDLELSEDDEGDNGQDAGESDGEDEVNFLVSLESLMDDAEPTELLQALAQGPQGLIRLLETKNRAAVELALESRESYMEALKKALAEENNLLFSMLFNKGQQYLDNEMVFWVFNTAAECDNHVIVEKLAISITDHESMFEVSKKTKSYILARKKAGEAAGELTGLLWNGLSDAQKASPDFNPARMRSVAQKAFEMFLNDRDKFPYTRAGLEELLAYLKKPVSDFIGDDSQVLGPLHTNFGMEAIMNACLHWEKQLGLPPGVAKRLEKREFS